ncbi:sulfotransferase domain-containing protein [Candidatus Pelagibacter sp. HIMB1321]|uniref:sulfotransferase domain-containing protein n=1 Tax=Candidatus Pelagibacter sp. HIMB1321 TaxID=1388755 RepID=UPI000A07E04E|nr:sulfotransferase domain-containing protein [Candidatus Pelagibacter sp. HIMB1321]SMF80661.1 Sulfotransferase domain-containing protein [Candidatus Pelagibacter sp. HIMB1321]
MIIWISSFPKSGNTWVRSIISALVYSDDGIFNFDLIKKIDQFPLRKHFIEFTKDIGNIHSVKKYWVLAQDKINLDNEPKFLKTHQINCNLDGYSFTNKDNTAATIYIIRDPRNVIGSISNHFSVTIEEAKNIVLGGRVLINKDKSYEHDVVTLLGSWSEHYKFWTKKNNNLLLLRYEDILLDPKKQLKKIILFLEKFIKFKIDNYKENNIIKSTSFKNLQDLEDKIGFNESIVSKTNKKIKFFNLGSRNNFKEYLDKKIQAEVETKFFFEMKELGYL